MKVKIKVAGPYALFGGPKIKAQILEAGDETDFPPDYANDIVAAGLADALEVVEMTKPEIVHEQKLTANEVPDELAKRTVKAKAGWRGRTHG